MRNVEVVVVWRRDRFGRSLKRLNVTLEELRTLAVPFYSYHEDLNFTTGSRQLMSPCSPHSPSLNGS